MISNLLLNDTVLRQIPEALLTRIRTGESKLYGSIIRSVKTGRIVGHLQETTGLANVTESALKGLDVFPGVGSAIDLVGHTASFVQNEQIKAAVETVRQLQLANLALGAAGIGVSVAGFAVLAAKIDRVERRLDGVGQQLDWISKAIDALRDDRIGEDFTRLRTAAEQLDEGWRLASPETHWRDVARLAHELENVFERRVVGMTASDGINLTVREPLLEALALATSTRVTARLAAGDDLAAQEAAEKGARRLLDCGQQLSLGTAALSLMNGEVRAGKDWSEALDEQIAHLMPIMDTIRERELTACTSSMTIAELNKQKISGRGWLEAARLEESSPLLCLLPG